MVAVYLEGLTDYNMQIKIIFDLEFYSCLRQAFILMENDPEPLILLPLVFLKGFHVAWSGLQALRGQDNLEFLLPFCFHLPNIRMADVDHGSPILLWAGG